MLGLNPSHPGCRRNRFNKQKFSALLECTIFVLKAYYLHDNWCQAFFIGLNARLFGVHLPKLFSPALKAAIFSFFQIRLNKIHRTQAIKFQQVQSPEDYMIKKLRKSTEISTLIALVLAIPAEEGLLGQGGWAASFSGGRGHTGACSMPRESSSVWVTAGHQPGGCGTPLTMWVK